MRFLNVPFLAWLGIAVGLFAAAILGITQPWKPPAVHPYPVALNADVPKAIALASQVSALPPNPHSQSGTTWCAEVVEQSQRYAAESGAAGRQPAAAAFADVARTVDAYCGSPASMRMQQRQSVAVASQHLLVVAGAHVPGLPPAPVGDVNHQKPAVSTSPSRPDRGPAPTPSKPKIPAG